MRERKLNRLSGYNQTQKGSYFITVFVSNHENVFGRIFNGEMILNENGKAVEMQWQCLFEQYKYLEIDEYTIMPDHFHGILHIAEIGHDTEVNNRFGSKQEYEKSLPQLISAFKSSSAKLIHELGDSNFRWQKSYKDEIIRDENALNNIREYIINNPANMDEEY